MRVYVFGNPLIKEDSWPVMMITRLKKILPQIDFKMVDPNENFPPKGEKDLIILDTVFGIKKPMVLDLDCLSLPDSKKKTPISPHDYDLLFHLVLLKKLKKINKVIIIGVPDIIKDELELINWIVGQINYFNHLTFKK